MKIASFVAASACGGRWVRSYVTSEEVPVSVARYVSNVKNGEKAIASGGNHFEREHLEVSDLDTHLEVVEPCQFEPEVYRTMSDHSGQRQHQKTTTVEVKKGSMVLTGEALHGVVLILQSMTEMSPQHKTFLPGTCVYHKWHCTLMYI